jgi:hypothetical protein
VFYRKLAKVSNTTRGNFQTNIINQRGQDLDKKSEIKSIAVKFSNFVKFVTSEAQVHRHNCKECARKIE